MILNTYNAKRCEQPKVKDIMTEIKRLEDEETNVLSYKHQLAKEKDGTRSK